MEKITHIIARHPHIFLLLIGAISATGFAPWGLWPFTLMAFAYLIAHIYAAVSARQAFGAAWIFGVGHFTIGNNWIATAFTFQAAMPAWLGWIAVVLLALYLALFPAFASLGSYILGQKLKQYFTVGSIPTLSFILIFAGFWTIFEWLRATIFTGFAWNPLGVILVDIGGIAQLIGTYGLSLLMIFIAGTLWILARQQYHHAMIIGGFSMAMLACSAFLTYIGGTSLQIAPKIAQYITVVQPNIPQSNKYEASAEAINYKKLSTLSTASKNAPPRLILWPEAAIPWQLESGYPYYAYRGQPGDSAVASRMLLTQLMNKDDVLITGSDRLEFNAQDDVIGARNSIFAISQNADILGKYDKAHLVPYGEYLALRWLLEPLGLTRLVPGAIDFWQGPGPRTLDLGRDSHGLHRPKMGVQICYEIIFSGNVIDRKNRPDFIFNPSNDAWFGTWGPPQHLAQARLRAVEEGLPVIRSTPTGISAIVAANGRIVKYIKPGVAGRIDAPLPPHNAETFFAKWGNIVPLILALLIIFLGSFWVVRNKYSV
ncbi:apolipoprotein N-acyltransferase [Sphingorhabdus lutea]|uniref:Apolipoprotein N-acyltransferase n=1 Tax=Sphingorhabdus lutea TaxID=1913578 RepID=A0A1L3JAN7_9SPHN|nr:apolipoprotein N-acyltransferase [Sphingorhabdus lutea]APG62179.1 apolipoprotein N-acyltransferase [Sphingorhabdus lutea]